MAYRAALREPLTPESADIASTLATAAQYSPVSGLLPNAQPGVLGVGPGNQVVKVNNPSFVNPSAPQVTNAPPAGVAGSISGIGGYTPDWASLIKNDPGLLDAQAALAAGGINDLGSRNAAINNALVQFGKVPDLAALAQQLGLSQADLQGIAGQDIQQLAKENTDAGLSTQARLDQANQNALRQLTASLNARGLLNSGEAGYQLDQQNLAYRQAQSDATQKLLGYLQQYQAGYAQAQQARAQSLASAYSDAANRQFQNNQGSAGFTVKWAFTDGQGTQVYTDPNGQLVTSDGSPYSAPAPTAQAQPVPTVKAPTVPTVKLPAVGGGGNQHFLA